MSKDGSTSEVDPKFSFSEKGATLVPKQVKK